ncbi:MAG: ribosomal RNA small subunit methyltransferase A [Deltaproteobacteria bacterium]|nr:ribosomal RNA small subunit methyltransferase A [Deltaproteobacteria bacterium]
MRPSLHPKTWMTSRGIRPKHSFGQNFLVDDQKLSGISRAALSLFDKSCDTPEKRTVIEFGPGLGALTGPLLDGNTLVHAIERDRDLPPFLYERFAPEVDEGRFVLHEANAVTHPLEPIFDAADGRAVIAGNLPYHLTSDLCLRSCHHVEHLHGAVFLMQLEVAERLTAEMDTKSYGVLTVLLSHFFETEMALKVKAGCFWPPPEVDGGVVRMKTREAPLGGEVPFNALRAVVKSAFHKRRKTLKNSYKHLENVDEVLEMAGVSGKLRPEQISVEGFVSIARAFAEKGIHVRMPGEAIKKVRHMAKLQEAEANAVAKSEGENVQSETATDDDNGAS